MPKMKDSIKHAIALLAGAEECVLNALAETPDEDVEVKLALKIQTSEIQLQRMKLISLIER